MGACWGWQVTWASMLGHPSCFRPDSCKLVPITPPPCSEANDMAMMMARLYTGAHDIVTLRNAYHGLSGKRGMPAARQAGCRPGGSHAVHVAGKPTGA